jgi:hypothetical protein
MIIQYEGQSYPFDFDDIDILQGIAIEKHTGVPFAEWGTAVEKGGNLLAMQALGWLILTGGDLDKPIGECRFKMGKLGVALANAVQAEADAAKAAEEAAPRPTVGGLTAPPEANGAPGGPLSAVYSELT